ncbi:MAG: ATP-binding protein [Planctomycetaceae bacterium]|nr:ATP-binding protein [Planctomycetaceae bacterium]
MTNDDRDIDSALREAVAGEVGRERFDLWFGDSVQLRLIGGSLRVSAADQFTIDRLRRLFRDELQTACRSLVAGPVRVEFAVDPALRERQQPEVVAADSRCETEVAASDGAVPRPAPRRFAHLNDYVVGRNNRVAYTAAQMIAERPGEVSPLFLYGPPGCGKTHLLEGIWSAVRGAGQARRVLYLTAEQFTSMFLEALRGSGLPSFRHKYRHMDLLLIDDVQFFLGKRATLVELQNTVDALLRGHRQLVLAADRAPASLAKFGSVLTARFSGGLVCGIEPADRATRLGILDQLSGRLQVSLPEDVRTLIVDRLDGDARNLAGAIHRLEASSRAFQRPIDLELAQSALLDMFQATARVVQLPDIDRAVCDVFGLDPNSLQSSSKGRAVSQPRALAMWLARQYTRAAYVEIGAYFGRRSHSTVISAQKQVQRWMDRREAIRLAHGHCEIGEAIRRVESQIRAG